jgi:hypothetical protein
MYVCGFVCSKREEQNELGFLCARKKQRGYTERQKRGDSMKTTKGGKVMNPTDAYRKELRKKELKRVRNPQTCCLLLSFPVLSLPWCS